MIKTEQGNFVLPAEEMQACAYALRVRIKALNAECASTTDGEVGKMRERIIRFCRGLLSEYNELMELDGDNTI